MEGDTMRLIRVSEMGEFPRVLVKVYACIGLLSLAAALIVWSFVSTVYGSAAIFAVIVVLVPIIVFIYIVECYSH
jgi:hypothetical protein